jgi:hypothetical protein
MQNQRRFLAFGRRLAGSDDLPAGAETSKCPVKSTGHLDH